MGVMVTAVRRIEEDEVQLTITYDGDAVARNRMAITDLAPAMLSLARLIETSAARLTGEEGAVRVEVRADFQQGSFAFDVVTSVLDAIRNRLFDNLSISDIITLLGLTGAAAKGLFFVVARIRNRKVTAIEDDGPRRLYRLEDGETLVVEAQVHTLLADPEVRAYVEGVTAPLRKPGYDTFIARAERYEPVVVTAAEAEYFVAPPPSTIQIQNTIRQELVRVLAPDFQAGHKWQVALAGEKPFYASIEDADFLHRVAAHAVKFGQDDILRADVRVEVSRKETGEYTRERTIVHVHDHIPGEKVVQGDLLLDA